jgi:outer membrane protein TolC
MPSSYAIEAFLLQFDDSVRQTPGRVRVTLILSLLTVGAQAEPLALPQLIERARISDARVKESEAQLRYFRAKYDEARWAWFPRVDSYFLAAGPSPEARNDGLGGPPTTSGTLMYDLDFGQPGVMLRAGAETVLPIFTFGKLDALEAAGKKAVEAGEALKARAQDETELQVSQAYFGYCLALSGKSIIADTAKRLDEAQATLERLRKQQSEQVTQMDVYKLQFYRQQLEVQLLAAEAGAKFALAAIRLLIGAQPGEQVDVAAVLLDEPSGTLLPLETYSAMASETRPELKAVAAGLGAREQEVLIRERMFLPDFGVAGFFRWAWSSSATRQLSPFAYDPYNDLSAGVALVARYQWDFPQKAIQLEQARAEYEKMLHQQELLRAAVRLETEKAFGEVESALGRSVKLALAEKHARRWSTAAFTAFDVGTGDTRELVDAFTALAASAAQKSQAFHDVKVSLRALSRAVGQRVELAPIQSSMALPRTLAPETLRNPR